MKREYESAALTPVLKVHETWQFKAGLLLRRDQVQSVGCTLCKAGPGQRCWKSGGLRVANHAVRVAAAAVAFGMKPGEQHFTGQKRVQPGRMTEAQKMAVDCPRCDALAGQPCHDRGGKRDFGRFHISREREAWAKALKDAAEDFEVVEVFE